MFEQEKISILSNKEFKLCLKSFNLSSQEQQEVKNALSNSNSQLDVVAKDGLLHRARYLNSIADNQARLKSMTIKELKKATFKGAADFRIEQVVNSIIEHNNNQDEHSKKVCLTRGIIFKLTGSNRKAINKWFLKHENLLDYHNQIHLLSDRDNRKGKNFNWEKLLKIS